MSKLFDVKHSTSYRICEVIQMGPGTCQNVYLSTTELCMQLAPQFLALADVKWLCFIPFC